MRDSIFVHMMEQNNHDHRDMVDWVVDSEPFLRRFCATLPEDRLLGRGGMSLERILMRERKHPPFKTNAGATCSFSNSLLILSRYASSLHHEIGVYSDVVYQLDDDMRTGFKYKAKLPNDSGFDGSWGLPMPNKSLGKRSAAWQTCYELRRMRLLDENLDSVHQRIRPENANARLAVSGQKDEYDMKIKPDFWLSHCGSTPKILYATRISLSPARELKRAHSELVLLTRSPLPALPNFPVYLEGDVKTDVSFASIEVPIEVDALMLDKLTLFSLTLFKDLFNKQYERDVSKMGYWLAPGMSEQQPSSTRDMDSVIDLGLLQKVHDREGLRISWKDSKSPEEWSGRFLVDLWHGGCRYLSGGRVPAATKDSLRPQNVAHVATRSKQSKTVAEYTFHLFGQTRESRLKSFDPTQPVFEADMVQLKRNCLAKATDADKAWVSCAHIVPEPLGISLLDLGVVSTGLVFPAIMSRMDSYLIALEAIEKLDLKVPADLALEAFTKDSDNTEEHKEQQIQFQRGMGKNYERLEFIGDSLLKMTTSIMVFIR